MVANPVSSVAQQGTAPEGIVVDMRRWMPDQAAEALFWRLGISWTYRTGVEIALIDRKASLQNQARLGVSLVPETVDEYALAMMDGAAFPALVAFARPSGTYVLAGGNHRNAAAVTAGIRTVDLYVLDVQDESIRRLVTTSLNTLVGMRPGRSETIEQAIAWMDRYGAGRGGLSAAAKFYGVPESSLSLELRYRAARNRIRLAGISPDSLNKTHLDRIAQLQNDNVLREVAALQVDANLAERDLKELVLAARAERTEAAQIAVVTQYRARDDVRMRIAQGKRAAGAMQVTTKKRADIFRSLRTIENLLGAHVTRGQVGLSSGDDYQRAVTLARSVVTRLESLDGGA